MNDTIININVPATEEAEVETEETTYTAPIENAVLALYAADSLLRLVNDCLDNIQPDKPRDLLSRIDSLSALTDATRDKLRDATSTLEKFLF